MGEREHIEELLVQLQTDYPGASGVCAQFRAYLRTLDAQEKMRALLREVVDAVTDSSHLGADIKETLDQVRSLLERLVEQAARHDVVDVDVGVLLRFAAAEEARVQAEVSANLLAAQAAEAATAERESRGRRWHAIREMIESLSKVANSRAALLLVAPLALALTVLTLLAAKMAGVAELLAGVP